MPLFRRLTRTKSLQEKEPYKKRSEMMMLRDVVVMIIIQYSS